jgi:ABC-type oligopeptide transport system substrate-binding subunit
MLALGAVALLTSGCTPINLLPQPTATPYHIPDHYEVFNGIMVTDRAPDIATLDPNLASDTNSLEVVRLIFDGLVTLDRNLNVKLWGAKQIDISADGLTYKFRLFGLVG